MIRMSASVTRIPSRHARIAGAKHLDPRSSPDAELFEPMHVIRLAFNVEDLGHLTGSEVVQRNHRANHGIAALRKESGCFFGSQA